MSVTPNGSKTRITERSYLSVRMVVVLMGAFAALMGTLGHIQMQVSRIDERVKSVEHKLDGFIAREAALYEGRRIRQVSLEDWPTLSLDD